MDKVTLQIPVSKSLRIKAEKTAIEQGFSSLQEFIRVLLKKIADKSIEITFQKPKTIQLSPKAIKRYNKILDDYNKGKNIYHAKNVDDLFKQLNQ